MNDLPYPDDELPMSKRDRMWNGIAPHLPHRVRDGRVLDAMEHHAMLCEVFDGPSYEEVRDVRAAIAAARARRVRIATRWRRALMVIAGLALGVVGWGWMQ